MTKNPEDNEPAEDVIHEKDDAHAAMKKNKDKPTKKKKKELGSGKAVETMFRTAIRSELEIITLAAMKANIMISLNGLIISALMISGAFIFSSTAAFLFPATVFLITAALSIVFALLAASPERAGFFDAVKEWLTAMRRKEATFRDLPKFVAQNSPVEQGQNLNLLIYEHRVTLTREDHWERMQDLLRDQTEVYHQMSDQLYWLGQMASRKFRMLNISYTIFRWGLLASVLAFISVKFIAGFWPGLSGEAPARLRNVGIAEFTDIYEPSAVQQLPDGRIIVVEDEASRAMSLMDIAADGSLVENAANDVKVNRAFGRRMNDLEGLSIDDDGYVYAITSHSKNKDGERKPDREQLLRFKVEGNSVGNISSSISLRDEIIAADQLVSAIRQLGGGDVDLDRLNIEGLAYYKVTGVLMIGLREPMVSGQSIILTITNPAEVFDSNAAPEFGPPVMLDLQDGGIRALSYDPVLNTFLIVNEIEGYEGNRYSQLWSWSGDPEHAPEPLALPDIINLNNVESIDSIVVNNEPHLLLMSDEGDEKKNIPARYMMLKYDQIGK